MWSTSKLNCTHTWCVFSTHLQDYDRYRKKGGSIYLDVPNTNNFLHLRSPNVSSEASKFVSSTLFDDVERRIDLSCCTSSSDNESSCASSTESSNLSYYGDRSSCSSNSDNQKRHHPKKHECPSHRLQYESEYQWKHLSDSSSTCSVSITTSINHSSGNYDTSNSSSDFEYKRRLCSKGKRVKTDRVIVANRTYTGSDSSES